MQRERDSSTDWDTDTDTNMVVDTDITTNSLADTVSAPVDTDSGWAWMHTGLVDSGASAPSGLGAP